MKIGKTALGIIFVIAALLIYLPQIAFAQDTDGDGMPDAWENIYPCMMANTVDDGVDYDSDNLTSLEEYGFPTDPCNADTDGDGMDDGWEIYYLSCGLDPFTDDSIDDPDIDGVNNLLEYGDSTDPCVQNDTDEDGMPDIWENKYSCLMANTVDGEDDPDSDGISNLSEYAYSDQMNPCDEDTDGDGMDDGWENTYTCLNPLSVLASPSLVGTYENKYLERSYILGNYAYIMDYYDGLYIIDISDPEDPVLAGDYYTPDHSWGVYVSGDFAYSWYRNSIQIINVSDPANTSLAGSFSTLDYTFDIHVVGDYAYVASYEDGLLIFDVSNPANPTNVGTFDTPGYAVNVYVSGNYAYVSDSSSLLIIDISDPANPTLTGSYNDNAYNVSVSGNLAYVMGEKNDLYIINISSPSTPYLLGIYDFPELGEYDRFHVYIDGNFLYLAYLTEEDISELLIVDVSDSSNPTLIDTYDEVMYATDVFVSGDYIYLLDAASGLEVISKVNPDGDGLSDYEEYILGTDPCNSDTDGDGLADGDEANLYLTDPTNPDTDSDGMDDGWEVLNGSSCGLDPFSGDTSQDNDGDGVSNIMEYNAGTMPCNADTDSDGMDDLWEVANTCMNPTSFISELSLAGKYDTHAWGVHVRGDYAYVMSDTRDLNIIDVSNPANPVLVGNCDELYFELYDIYIEGNYAYITAYPGFYIVNISDPQNPTFVSYFYTPAWGVYVSRNYAYVAAHFRGLQIIDISAPASPILAGNYDTPGYARGVFVSGSYAYVADEFSGLQIIDISNPASPILTGSYETLANAFDVFVSGDYAYVADGETLQIIDVSNPADPILASSYGTPNWIHDVYAEGNYVYLANDNVGGLQIVDVNDPANPTLAASYDTPGYASGIFVSGNYAYVADGYDNGLQVILLTDGDGDGLPDIDEYNLGTNPCNIDTDGDGLNDNWEVKYGLDPLVDDSMLDDDSDGLNNAEEYLAGTDPGAWDSDGDGMPDPFEVSNSSGHTVGINLDATYPADGMTADFDNDGNPNSHEFWNGTDPWSWDPTGGAGCGYWGDAGEMGFADGIVSSSDLAALKLWLSGNQYTQYDGVIPPGGGTHDLDSDGSISSGDLAILTLILSDTELSDLGMPTRPNNIVLINSPSGSISVGDTCQITVAIGNVGGTRTPGIGVVFEIDPLSTGTATILGGEGEDTAASRYDISGEVVGATGGEASVVLRIDSPGDIIINTRIPECGTGPGRYAPEVVADGIVTVVGE